MSAAHPVRIDACLLAARAAYGDGSEIAVLGEGQLNIALQLGDDLVVRFPRHPFGVGRLVDEVTLLDVLSGHFTGVSVPRVVAVALDRPVGGAHVAHQLVAGTLLRPEAVARFDEPEMQALSATLAQFLTELHAATAAAAAVGTQPMSVGQFAAQLHQEAATLLFPRMTAGGIERVRRELDGLSGADGGHALLCHTDIGGNVVLDETTGRVGVIDFGSAMISDPILDLASLRALSPTLADLVGPAVPSLRDRAAAAVLVQATFALQDALYGARQQEWAYVDEVLGAYNQDG